MSFGNRVYPHNSINLSLLYREEHVELLNLQMPFTELEVKKAIFSCTSEKAPGPDGLLMLFYQRYWDYLKVDILEFFADFYRGAGDLSDLNSSWVLGIVGAGGSTHCCSLPPLRYFSTGFQEIPSTASEDCAKVTPYDPLLFILCVDVLFKMLQRAVDSNAISAVGIGNLKVHTLQFADDTLMFFDGSLRTAAAIKLILDGFSENSGLNINYNKSAIIPINLSQEQSSALSSSLGCSTQDFPFTYLGLPLTPKPLSKSEYLPLIEKIDKRLAGWKEKSLSKGGRLVLLNSVISTIPTYLSSVFQLPIWVQKAIDKTRRGLFGEARNYITDSIVF
uniref:Reverse transcriptase domain-containing protein n=1 Tax=Ananas comosus var. bracteatus TaxID=296719 RepID=A0A6V7NWI1_ANACO|nr:unnamed protein product [Ananas comosus var. bracteatus]